jgi:hypothetical protein
MSDEGDDGVTDTEAVKEVTSDASDENQQVSDTNPPSQEPPINLIIDRVADRAEPLIEIFKTFAERSAQAQETKVKFRIGMTLFAVITVLVLVGTAAFLTYVGRIGGSTFSFLLGLIIGYMLTFIRDAIGPTSTDEL